MNFKANVMRSAVAAGLAVVLLASCGGGTQVESFVPSRVIAFGDEASLINTDGSKYTVNGVVFNTTVTPSVPADPTVVDCTANQIWVQQLASSYGLAFAGRCPSSGTNANGVMMAAEGAKVADLTAQVTAFLASDAGFASNDLVTVMVGVNDVLDALNQADPIAAVEQAGTQVGAEVVRITNLGAKVIVSTIPDVGFTPNAITRESSTPGSVAQLSELTTRFNTRLRLKLQDVRDGGRAVGLVLADEQVLAMVRNPAIYGLINIDKPVCSVSPVTACNATTLDGTAVVTSYGNDWLWADDLHLGANAQSRLGSLAVTRARNNPF
jgi:outer membrane lipase/esterase